jgi:uncharacterized membrane protein YedE/YeeE
MEKKEEIMFESVEKLVLGLITGFVFGFLLQKGRVTKYRVILGQLLLKDWTVLKIMATAIVVGAIGVYFLLALEATKLDVWPFQLGGVLLGALLFGMGMAVLGYCPGTGLAGAGEGSRDAMVGVAGMLTGASVFVIGYNWLEPIILGLGDYGQVSIPDSLRVSPALIIAALVVVVALTFALIEYVERRKPRLPSMDHQTGHKLLWGKGNGKESSTPL